MLYFKELRLTSKTIIIDVAVVESDYYKNINISNIIIDNQDTFIVNGPSSKPVYSHDVTTPNTKHIRLELPLSTLKILPTDILFVYVIASGVPSPSTPCGHDNSKLIGTVVDLKRIYTKAISYLREIECMNECKIPKHFINFILQYKALELSIKTGNYLQAIKYWKKFFTKVKVTSKCNCYGNN